MSRRGYEKGNHWLVCDRCGFDVRVNEVRRTWDGLYVCFPECWEPRHPQDFVRAKADRQAVYPSRPAKTYTHPSTTLNGAVAQFATQITVTSDDNIADETPIGITMSDGAVFWTFSDGTPAANVVTLATPMPLSAATGAAVLIGTVNDSDFPDPTYDGSNL